MSIREEYWGVPYQIIDGVQTYWDIYQDKAPVPAGMTLQSYLI